MARLILINGMPGLGKSTLARRYAADRPGTLVCDIDVLRTFISGWREDFGRAGEQIRPAALGLIGGYLRGSGDVVLPQLLAKATELERFERAAEEAGAELVHVMLTADTEDAVRRFHRRDDGSDPWHAIVEELVAEDGGDDTLRAYAPMLADLVARRPGIRQVTSIEGDPDATYERLIVALDRG